MHILTQVEIEDIENLNKKMHSKKLHLFLNGNPILCNCDCNDLRPRKKAPCLSEPINPIPSDACFITKRSTFLNVLKNPLSMDEHLE
jgi:hypothetical protein